MIILNDESLKVLLAVDGSIRQFLELTLKKWSYKVIVAKNYENTVDILRSEDAPKIVIIDQTLLKTSIDDFFDSMSMSDLSPPAYLLLLIPQDFDDSILDNIDEIPMSLHTKPVSTTKLHICMNTARRIIFLEKDFIAAREALAIQATHDPYTNLWNYTSMMDILEKEISRVSRTDTKTAISVVKIDRFEEIVKELGHQTSQKMIYEVTLKLRFLMREYDYVGHFTKNDYLIIFPGCDSDQAMHIMERLKKSFMKEQIDVIEKKMSVSISYGISSTEKTNLKNVDGLIKAATEGLNLSSN